MTLFPKQSLRWGVLTVLVKGSWEVGGAVVDHFDQEKLVLGDTCSRLAYTKRQDASSNINICNRKSSTFWSPAPGHEGSKSMKSCNSYCFFQYFCSPASVHEGMKNSKTIHFLLFLLYFCSPALGHEGRKSTKVIHFLFLFSISDFLAQGLWTLGFGRWALDFGFWISDFGFRMLTLDVRLWFLYCHFVILDSGLWFLEFRSRFPHSPKSKVLGLWALDLGLWVMDFAFSVLGFGFWI